MEHVPSNAGSESFLLDECLDDEKEFLCFHICQVEGVVFVFTVVFRESPHAPYDGSNEFNLQRYLSFDSIGYNGGDTVDDRSA